MAAIGTRDLRLPSGARGAAAPAARGAPGLDLAASQRRPAARDRGALPAARRRAARASPQSDPIWLGGAVHNGFAAELAQPDVAGGAGDGAARGDPGFVVLAEDVQDPRNLGALLRVCEGAGVGRVLVRDRGSAPLSATAAKTSAGASEWLDGRAHHQLRAARSSS